MHLLICGDIALSGKIENEIVTGRAKEVLRPIRSIFRAADLVLGNIECPITNENQPGFPELATLKAHKRTAEILSFLGITVGSLANNHIADYGVKGLKDTIEVLENQKISWLGAGFTQHEARQPLVLNVSGTRIAILALAQKERSSADIRGWGAGGLEEKYAIETTRKLREQTDLIIGYFHFGVEFAQYPTPYQISFCHRLVEEGAQIVIGHHPHVPQGYEFYKGGFIAYSLGNFIFDMTPGAHKFERMGLVIKARIKERRVDAIQMMPFDTNSGFPLLIADREKREADSYLAELAQTILDKNTIRKTYYTSCRDNLYTTLDALIRYGLLKRNLTRMKLIIEAQLWPQILQLRRDLMAFLVTGYAAKYETTMGKSKSKLAQSYRILCWIVYLACFYWILKRISRRSNPNRFVV